MKNRKEKRKFFLEYCRKVWFYLKEEMMVDKPQEAADEEDVYFYFEAGHDIQSAAFLIKEIIY